MDATRRRPPRQVFLMVFLVGIAIGKVIGSPTDSQQPQPTVIESSDPSVVPLPRIIGGRLATANSTAHQVSIRVKRIETSNGPGAGTKCGGSLISATVVLTAAHCLFEEKAGSTPERPKFQQNRASDLVIVAGQLLLNTATNETQRRDIAWMKIHPNYTHQFSFDLAVIRLAGAPMLIAPPARAVGAIPLARTRVADATICQVTGWGTLKYGENALSNALMSVDVPIVNIRRCNASYGFLDNAMICAGDFDRGGKDACQGDSGGPMVCNGVLAGVVSFGAYCGEPKYPGVYVDVSYYRTWIEKASNGAPTIGGSMVIGAGFVASIVLRWMR